MKHECNGDISIMLIDHDTASITLLTSMLEKYPYKVISVKMASKAISMIEKEEKKIGFIIANIEIPHIDSHSFLTVLSHKDIPLILITPEIEANKPLDLLKRRACFCLKKPFVENEIKNLLQYVTHKKKQELEKLNIVDEDLKYSEEAFRKTLKRQRTSESSLLGKRKFTETLFTRRTIIANVEIDENQRKVKKSNIENVWTHERHMKFLSALTFLSENDSHPKSILKFMNDPNLNQSQVTQHFEKYKAIVDQMKDTLFKNKVDERNKEKPKFYLGAYNIENIPTGRCIPQFYHNPFRSTSSYVPHQVDLSHMGESYNMNPFEDNMSHMDWSPSENMIPSRVQDGNAALKSVNKMFSCEEYDEIPIQDLIYLDNDQNEIDMTSWLQSCGISEVPLTISNIGIDTTLTTLMDFNKNAINHRDDVERETNVDDEEEEENMDWIDDIINEDA